MTKREQKDLSSFLESLDSLHINEHDNKSAASEYSGDGLDSLHSDVENCSDLLTRMELLFSEQCDRDFSNLECKQTDTEAKLEKVRLQEKMIKGAFIALQQQTLAFEGMTSEQGSLSLCQKIQEVQQCVSLLYQEVAERRIANRNIQRKKMQFQRLADSFQSQTMINSSSAAKKRLQLEFQQNCSFLFSK